MTEPLKKIVVRAKSPTGDTVQEEWDRCLKRGEVARFVGHMKKSGRYDGAIVLPENPLAPQQLHFFATDEVRDIVRARFPRMSIENEPEAANGNAPEQKTKETKRAA